MATWWVYLRVQAVVLVIGIVGPIFLIGYFASAPDPTMKWMYWWGLVITFADVLIALLLTGQFVRDRTAAQRDDEERP